MLITTFVICTSGTLWNTTLTSLFEWSIFFGGVLIAGIIQLSCMWLPKAIANYTANIFLWGWCLFAAMLVTHFWTPWPTIGILHLVEKLMPVVALFVFAASRLIGLSTNTERNLCGALLYFYALAVLTPKLLL